MADFLWHELNEKEKLEIEKQAKEILDNFSSKLSEIDLKGDAPLIEREQSSREEGSGKSLDLDREQMFENAPNKNTDFILGERAKW